MSPGARPPEGALAIVRERALPPLEGVRWISHGSEWIPSRGVLGKDHVYRFEGVGDFVLAADGHLIRAFLDPRAHASLIEFVLTRGIIPRALHLRGITCLHASAVMVDDEVVAFLGPSGSGKSTVAAAMASRGYPFMSDDVLPIRAPDDPRGALAGPGLHDLRLYPQAARLLGLHGLAAPTYPGASKITWRPGHEPLMDPRPLRRVFILRSIDARTGRSPRARRGPTLGAAAAFLALQANSFWMGPDETSALASDMKTLARVLLTVRVKPLFFQQTREGFDALERIVRSEMGSDADEAHPAS
jgi:hypothetical protein